MNVVPLDSIETQLLALGVPDLDHIADGAFLRDGPFNGWPGGGVAGRHASISEVLVQQADGTLADGKSDKVEGKIQNAVGGLKDALKK